MVSETQHGALIPGLTEGRMVHFVLDDPQALREGDYQQAGPHRPAVIVRVWNRESGTCNLNVFLDGSNDQMQEGNGPLWRTSVAYDPTAARVGTWHFIEPVA